MRKTKLITISISPELFERVDQMARDEDRTRSWIFREAFKRYWAEKRAAQTRGQTSPIHRKHLIFNNLP
ncbi:MAG: CopG family ribbon-helix-helix protein [Syntrophobacteraceae bacterium]